MKSTLFFSMFPCLSSVFISFACVVSAHSHGAFLSCLLSANMSEVVYTPKNATSYSTILESAIRNLRFSTPSTPKPLAIITPLQASHVQATISCSRKHGVQIRIRSGGHDMEGLSYVSEVPFVVLDLFNFRSVDVDVENETAWVQSGAILGEFYYKIAEKSKTLGFPGGACHTVGIGGYFSGGGYGPLFRKYGLAVDNVIDAQFMDVNGRILDRKSMGEDLFWAIRGGGGGSFGIALAWKVKLVPVPETITIFTTSKTLDQNATKLLHIWQYIAPKLPNDITFSVSLTKMNSSHGGNITGVAVFDFYYLGNIEELIPIMKENFPELEIVKEDCIEMSWIDSIVYLNQFQNKSLETLLDRNYKSVANPSHSKTKSDYVKDPMPETALKNVWPRLLEDEEIETGVLSFVAYGGKMDEIPDTATPFPHRAGNLYKVVYSVGWEEDDDMKTKRYLGWVRRLYGYMSPYVSKSPRQAYINYRDLDIGTNNYKGNTSYEKASIWGRKYFNNNFDKLVSVKTFVDPENFFKHEQSIPLRLSS